MTTPNQNANGGGSPSSTSSSSSTPLPNGTNQGQSQTTQATSMAVLCGEFRYRGDPATLGSRWEEWLERFELSVTANSLTDPDKTKALFCLLMGHEALAIWKSKRGPQNSESLAEVKKVMTEYFVPKRSEYTEVCKFRRAMRLEGECVADYVMRLRTLAQYCKFGDVDKEIERQLVIGCGIEEFERACCLKDDLTLAKAIDLAVGYECVTQSVNGLHKPTENEQVRGSIHHIGNNANKNNSTNNGGQGYDQGQRGNQYGSYRDSRSGKGQSQGGASYAPNSTEQQGGADKCGNCGNAPHLEGQRCPAKGVECYRCHRHNHFSHMCRSGTHMSTGQQPQGGGQERRRPDNNTHGRSNSIKKKDWIRERIGRGRSGLCSQKRRVRRVFTLQERQALHGGHK